MRDIRNGKSKIAQFTGMLASMLISRKIKLRPRPKGSPKPWWRIGGCKGNPVFVSTGGKILGGPENLDFTLPGLLPIEWARGYDSNDLRRDGLFGMGWSVPYEVEILRVPHPEGGELWIYVDEEGTRLELGRLKAGYAFVSVLDGLAFFQLEDGQTVVEDIYTGLYQVFQTDPHNPKRSRLIKLGDRNLNTLGLLYDQSGRPHYMCDDLSKTTVRLSYDTQHPKRVSQVARLYIKLGDNPHIEHTEVLASYRYTQSGQLQDVLDTTGQVLRSFTYTANGYLDSHTLPSGATLQYQWQRFEVPAQRPQSVRADGANPLLNHGIAKQLVEPGAAFFCGGHGFAPFNLAQHFQHMLARNLDDRQITQPRQDVFVEVTIYLRQGALTPDLQAQAPERAPVCINATKRVFRRGTGGQSGFASI